MSRRPRVLTAFVLTHRKAFAELFPAEESRLRDALGEAAWKAIDEAPRLGWVELDQHVALAEAIARTVGRQGASRVCRQAMLQSFRRPYLQPIFDGALRLMGRRLERFGRWTPKALPALFRDLGEPRWVEGPTPTLLLTHPAPAIVASPEYVEGMAACYDAFYDILDDVGRVEVEATPERVAFRFVLSLPR